MTFIIIVAAVVFAIMVISSFCRYIDYKEAYKDMNETLDDYWYKKYKKTTLTYDQFIKFYSICPDKWTIKAQSICYKIPDEKCEKYKTIWGEEKYPNFYIKFATYKDYKKYRKFYSNKEKQDAEMLNNKTGLEFVALMENECNLLREKSMKTIAESAENTKKIVEEMQNPNWDIKNYMPGKFTYEKRPEGTIVIK